MSRTEEKGSGVFITNVSRLLKRNNSRLLSLRPHLGELCEGSQGRGGEGAARDGTQRNRRVPISTTVVVSWSVIRRVSSVPMVRTGVTTIPAWERP